MYTTTLAFSYVLAPTSVQNNRRTLLATVAFAAGAFIGWPFALVLALPYVFEELFLHGVDRVTPEMQWSWTILRWKRLSTSALAASLIIVRLYNNHL